MMKIFLIFAFLATMVILFTNYDPAFATHMDSHHDEQMGTQGIMEQQMMGNMTGNHHMSFKGMCAPGFASLDGMCVLDDRCGPGAYPGRVCVMDGMMKQYLRPHHQKYAGISVDNIICVEGKELIFKHHNASPACVHSQSIEKLQHRGWQTEKPAIACTMEYAPVCGFNGKTYGNLCALQADHMKLKNQGECSEGSLITSFEDCINAGNPAMESHPRQCRTADGEHFVELIDEKENPELKSSTLYVDSKLVECVGVSIQQCMLVREDPNSDWEFFYGQIEGFEFQEGYEFKLEVQITKVENPPADASSLKYSLVDVLEKNIADDSTDLIDGVYPHALNYTKQSPEIDQDKGYFVDEIADGIFWLIGSGYQVMFLTTGEGVIVIDAPQPLGEKYLDAIKSVTDEPITHMIYSHSHQDHTGFAGKIFPKDIEYIAHQDTADILILENDPNRPIPTITFDETYTLSVGNQNLELYYIGPFHSMGDIVIYSPAKKIVMAVDLFHPDAAPYKGFGVTVNLDEHLKAHDTLVEEFDFDVLVSGHEQILGTKDHIKTDKEFVLSVMNITKEAMDLVSEDEVIQTCVDLTTEQWQGRLADLDQFMIEHCTAMNEYLLS